MATAPVTDEQRRQAREALDKAGGDKTAAARLLGLNPSTYRNRLREEPSSSNTAAQLDQTVYALRKQLAELRAALKDQHELRITETEARKIMGTLRDHHPNPPAWLISAGKQGSKASTPEVPVLMLGDWHAGEVVDLKEQDGINEFNKGVLKRRVNTVVGRAISLATEYGPGTYPGIVVCLLGDMVQGSIHQQGGPTDDMEPLPAALEVFDLLVWALMVLKQEFGQVYVPCAAGNHGRNTPKPEFNRYVFKNYDWLIYQMLIRHFQGDKKIVFDCRPSNAVNFRIWRTRFRVEHGDMLGVKGGDGIIGAIGPVVRGEVKTRSMAMSTVADYDHLLIGHWHQPLWLPRVFVNNTLKGWCSYAKNALKTSPSVPCQNMFYVHPDYGVTSRWQIFAEGKKQASERAPPWLTTLEAA